MTCSIGQRKVLQDRRVHQRRVYFKLALDEDNLFTMGVEYAHTVPEYIPSVIKAHLAESSHR